MPNTYSTLHVEAALCAWEAINEEFEKYEDRRIEIGTATARLSMIDLGVWLDKAWNSLPLDVQDGGPFDWEFVPFVVGKLANPFETTEEEVLRVAKEYQPTPSIMAKEEQPS